MREQADQRHIVGRDKGRLRLIIRIAGGDHEIVVERGHRDDALRRRLFREHQADAGAVVAGLAAGGVMHLQDNVAAGLDLLGLPRLPHIRHHARSVDGQNIVALSLRIAETRARVRDLGNIRHARLGVLQPRIPRFADEHHGMVHHGAIAGANFHLGDPLILGEAGRYDDVLILDFALGGHFECGGHLDHVIGLRDVPSVHPGARLGRVGLTAFGSIAVDPGGNGFDFGF